MKTTDDPLLSWEVQDLQALGREIGMRKLDGSLPKANLVQQIRSFGLAVEAERGSKAQKARIARGVLPRPEMQLILQGQRVRRQLRKPVPVTPPGEGFRTTLDGTECVTYDVSIDRAELERMALQAAENRTGRAVRGALSIRVTGRTPVRRIV